MTWIPPHRMPPANNRRPRTSNWQPPQPMPPAQRAAIGQALQRTDFGPLTIAGPYTRPTARQRAARSLMRAAGLLVDVARWLLGPRP